LAGRLPYLTVVIVEELEFRDLLKRTTAGRE
jgi:hypothetical protein